MQILGLVNNTKIKYVAKPVAKFAARHLPDKMKSTDRKAVHIRLENSKSIIGNK